MTKNRPGKRYKIRLENNFLVEDGNGQDGGDGMTGKHRNFND